MGRHTPSIIIAALLILWATRIVALDALPLHNDEGLHLTRAVAVWDGHPFWAISDGKIINHWPIALFFPQHAPDFVARIATIMVGVIGLAAGLALARQLSGTAGIIAAAALWIGSPYLFFFERMALSDAEAGAWVVVSAWSAILAARSPAWIGAVRTGLLLGIAALFKFTAAPYALLIVILLLFTVGLPLRRRVGHVVLAGLVGALCFVPPLTYLLLRGDDFFSVALGWVGVGGPGGELALVDNLARLLDTLTGFGSIAWVMLLSGGLVALWTDSRARPLIIGWSLPLLAILLFGREALPRHFVVVLPLALILSGAGLGVLLNAVEPVRLRRALVLVGGAALLIGALPFALTAYRDPGTIPLPRLVYTQYVADHSAGFGLREAVRDLPGLIERDAPVIGSMFPDGCRRANFYATDGYRLHCGDAPGVDRIETALDAFGAAYVLTDEAPLIGVDVATIQAQAVEIARFPRPDETAATASVILWRLTR